MEKEKVLNLLERYEEFLAERKAKKSNIHMALEITIRPDGSFKHYIFIMNEESGKTALAHIKGFERIFFANEVETFNDVLKALERKENE